MPGWAERGPLVIKLTWGAEAPERVGQALSVASAGVAAGDDVSLWLTGDAVLLAMPGVLDGVELAAAPPLAELLRSVLDTGAVTACSQCAARRGLAEPDLLSGVRIAGAATFLAEARAPGATALVY